VRVVDTSFRPSSISVTLENAFDFLSAEYRALFEASSCTVFQAPAWLSAFYRNLVEPLSLSPLIITLRDENGLLLGVFACVRQITKGVKIVQPADMGVSDYNCIVVREDAIARIKADPSVERKIFKAMTPWDVFFFRKQRSDKPKIEDILPGGTVSANDYCAHEVALNGDYEAWALDKLSANFRQANRRKLKKLMSDHGNHHFEVVRDKKRIAAALKFIRDHRGARFADDILKQPAFFNFYLDLAQNHVDSGFVQTAVSTVNGEIAAAFFGLNHNATHCYLLGGFMAEKYDRYSIGTLTMMALIKGRIEHGFSTFDFALGDESYKERFGPETIGIHNTVYAKTLIGKMLSFTYKNAKPLKDLLKKLNPNLR